MITQESLKQLFDYDPSTGVVTRKVSRQGHAKAGDVVGTVQKKGYLSVQIHKKLYRLHRLIWLYVYGEWPASEIDHINGIPSDNRICNLRLCTFEENQRNKGLQKNNSSGVKGVSFCKQTRKWKAVIFVSKQNMVLGRFADIKDADKAVRAAREKYYGAFANHG